MRKLLRKMFYWDAPAEGAVFASLLFWLGGWCLATVFVFFNGMSSSFEIAIAADILTTPDYLEWLFGWPQILLPAALAVCLYHLIVTGRFYHTLIREKWRYGIWGLTALYLCGSVAAAWLYGDNGLMIFQYVMLCWAFPMVCMPKQWTWLIPAAFGPMLILFPFAAGAETLEYLLDSIVQAVTPDRFAMQLLEAAPWLLWPSVLLAVLCVLCGFKAYAGAAGKPFRSLFGKGAAVIMILFLLTYGVSFRTAYAAHCRTDRSFAALEKHFGRPVNAEGLKDLYYQNRKPDGAFWRKALALAEKPEPGLQPQDPYYDLISHPKFRLSPEEFAAFRKRLESSRSLRELEKLFESELPAFEYDFRQGMIVGILFPELNTLRRFAWSEAWRVRFAIADRDPAAASAALKRIRRGRDQLANVPFLIPMLVMCGVENIRLDALEFFLSSGLPSDAWLAEEQKRLADFRKRMETVNYHALYGEAVMIMDVCVIVASGCSCPPEKDMTPTPGLYDLRWLFPAGWYQLTRARGILAESYRTTDLSQVVYKRHTSDTAEHLAGIFLAALDSAGRKLHSLSARCLTMETLIGIELEKRRTGKYPDKLENPPIDPFGEPLIYRKGKMPYIQYQRTVGTDHPYGEEKRITVDAVAVWSKGPDRKDDQGLSGWEENGKRIDDARAMLITEPKGILP
ncbi:MAG: hypothetical protein E7055_21040 [Lentisphaerae bacterium]|nr:hypothetical protein [Lentisphaerota bacterium]